MLYQPEPDTFDPSEEKPDLPATFGEGFEAAWNEGRLFSQSIAGENARMEALQDHIDQINTATGKDINQSLDFSSEAPGAAGAALTADDMLPQVNAAAAKLGRPELSPDQLEQMAVAKSRAAGTAYAQEQGREQTWGSRIGSFLGGALAQATDPINLLALGVAPEAESTSIVAAALRWGGVAGASQAAIEATGAPYHEAVQPGYLASGAPVENVLSAATQGAVLGGATRFLGNAWTRVKTGAWPQSVRDAGNLVESEANVADSNVYPDAAGEVAHRQALSAAIDNILAGKPVDVSDIITPDLEAQSRNLMMRLEGERGVALPIADERSLRLMGEEAALREQHAALGTQIEGLPEGDLSAADRLNRLQAVDQQIAAAPDLATRRALGERRHQILVDTSPEALQEAAAPIAQRQALGAQQDAIAGRLADIQRQRAQIEVENLGRAPAMLGQTTPIRAVAEQAAEPARGVPIVQARALAARLAEEAKAAGRETGEVQPELPFEATGAQASAQEANQVLASGVQQIARRAGYDMPDEEAAAAADKLVKASPEEADDMLRELQVSPRQAAQRPVGTSPASVPAEAVEGGVPSFNESTLSTPDFAAALRADIDRERMIRDVQIPVDTDKDGNPVMASLDAAMDQVDAYKAAADEMQACASPAPEPAEQEAA